MMSQKTIILTVVLFAVIVAGMFMYARLKSHELKSSKQQGLLWALHDLTV